MDEFYIQKVLAGDSEAFRFIIRDYKDIGYSLAISVVKDEFVAQEVLQTSFVIAFSKLSTFKGKSKFRTWLYRIVINESFKALKKHKKEIVVYGEPSVNLPSENEDIASKIEDDHQKYYITETLKILSPNESLILRLFYLEENSVEDITEITGWTTTNIKVILHRARTNMREILKTRFNIDKQSLYA
jgi:RNA polymerase sigma factor (sigma-70 family)